MALDVDDRVLADAIQRVESDQARREGFPMPDAWGRFARLAYVLHRFFPDGPPATPQ